MGIPASGIVMSGAIFTGSRRAAERPMMAAGLLAALAVVAACSTGPTRIPYTQQEQVTADIPGIPGARLWADDPAIVRGRGSVTPRVRVQQPIVLALSGGGADGDFGAGLLAGWSANGTRPQFTFVTG